MANGKIEIKQLSCPFGKSNVEGNHAKDTIVNQIESICKNCHNNNPPGSNFCNKCGSKLSMV